MRLDMQLSGEFAVALDGRPVDLSATARQGRHLLAYLALNAERPVGREELLDRLWPGTDPARAGAALSQTLSRVRRALGPDVLERLPNGAHRIACELHVDAGPDLLAGDEAEWLEPYRRELHERHLDTLERQARTAEPVQAEALARQVIAHAPDRESAWALLMEAQNARGNPTEATKTYHELRARLRDEYGTTPSAALVDLHAALLERPHRPHAASHVVPTPLNRTIGREAVLAELAERLRTARLVTVTGFGGVGKTRVALELAARTPGARFVALAGISAADDLPEAVAAGLEIPAEQTVLRFLATQRLLLVLDNCEHLPALPAFVREVLEACPGVTVLATSREPLALAAEQRYPLPTLDEDAAVALFSDRAAAIDPAFEPDDAVIEITERLDSALAAPALRDAPERQQTLKATIDWSYQLLSAEEQACFTRFAVFAGGATLSAAEEVGGGSLDTYDRLVAKSLLVRRPGVPTRLTMLATVREHARGRLDEATRERHYGHYLAIAERHGNERALHSADRKRNLAVLDLEYDNFNAAVAWAIDRRDVDATFTLCAALRWYWLISHRRADTFARVERALALPGGAPGLRARVLHVKAYLLWPLGRWPDYRGTVAEAERLAREAGDPWLLADVLSTRSATEADLGDHELADALAAEPVHWAHADGDEWTIARASYYRARVASTAPELRARVAEAHPLLRGVGNLNHLAALLAAAAYLALCLGEDEDAVAYARRAMPLGEQLDDPYQLLFLAGIVGVTELFAGDVGKAREAFRDTVRRCRDLAVLPAMEGLAGLAAVAVADGDLARAARLAGAAEAHRYEEPRDALDARRGAIFEAARARFPGWDAAYAEGAALSFADSIDYALQANREP